MDHFQKRLFICGSVEKLDFQSRQITHIICIANPGASPAAPPWFNGASLQFWFGDVCSEADARECKTRAPDIEDIRRSLEFFRAAWDCEDSKIMVTCDYGASRSPALAYIFIADQLGAGREEEAFGLTLQIRPEAVPNGLVVRIGDAFLERNGALLRPLKQFYNKLNFELFKQIK